IGRLPNVHKIQLRKDAQPKIVPLRRTPIALKEKLKLELKRLETAGIIEKVIEPTEWVSALVTVQKPDGSLRICLDPVYLNKAIQRQHFPFETLESIASRLNGAKVFSVLDLSQGFNQVELDEES
ncbi:uncharacterized protein B4U80_00752, partial [Leptotrombidium deliense]